MNILIVGLGLIGGSIAKKIKGFLNAEVFAIDQNEAVLEQAKAQGIIKEGFVDPIKIVGECDIIIVCLYPVGVVNFIKDFGPYIKRDALISDVSGVKGFISDSVDDLRFVPAHPMAGREVGGFENSTVDLFIGANYIITPKEGTDIKKVNLLKEFVSYLGAANVIITTPKEHDRMIAYTSQLMHVVAIALCDNPLLKSARGFSAGSLRDCTRVAVVNEQMWSELFILNKNELVEQICVMENSLDLIKTAIENEDKEGLCEIMSRCSNAKKMFL